MSLQAKALAGGTAKAFINQNRFDLDDNPTIASPQVKIRRRRRSQPRATIFDSLLIRCLVLAATGQNYHAELTTARTLAQVMEGGRR